MIGYYGYIGAAAGFGFLALLLLTSWRGSLPARLLALVVISNIVWAALAASVAQGADYSRNAYVAFEILRYAAWYAFLLRLLQPAAAKNASYRSFQRWIRFLGFGLVLLLLVGELVAPLLYGQGYEDQIASMRLTGYVLLAIMGLVIVEQLYRNTVVRHRWAIKYLFIGAGGLFAYDFYLYADALLFLGIDRSLWEARGFVNLAVVPLLTIAAARNRDWSLNLFVSRDIAVHTMTILGGGFYLLVMAGAGYYFREYGEGWGRIAQVLFFSLAIVLLVMVLFSGQLRTRLRVFLGKHFYRNKYDYRHEWLRLTAELNAVGPEENSFVAVIRVMANIVDARAGLLWLRSDGAGFRNAAAWQSPRLDDVLAADTSLARFLQEKGYVINLTELQSRPDEYAGLALPGWLSGLRDGWLVVPVFGQQALLGFIVLANPLVRRSINWEDRDLLKTAARQVGSHLAVLMTSEALAQARQFEAFNRVAAYMVHDLKNIGAELEMVASNARRHRDNPEFLDDAFDTVISASADIRRLLEQLRSKQVVSGKQVVVELEPLIRDVVGKQQGAVPVPVFEGDGAGCTVVAEKARLASVIAHLVQNAQQATAADGAVNVKLSYRDSMCLVEIRDTGHGMDAGFIRDRLFTPFDTTKGNAGMGIGMFESREFVRQLGGEIHVESEPGKGTLVALQFPVNAPCQAV